MILAGALSCSYCCHRLKEKRIAENIEMGYDPTDGIFDGDVPNPDNDEKKKERTGSL